MVNMLTLMAMRWNQQKFANLTTSLTHRYQKVITLVLRCLICHVSSIGRCGLNICFLFLLVSNCLSL